jgi:hypothetical protein
MRSGNTSINYFITLYFCLLFTSVLLNDPFIEFKEIPVKHDQILTIVPFCHYQAQGERQN